MAEHTKTNQNTHLLLSRMEDLAQKAARVGVKASKFLTPAEAHSVAEHFRHKRTGLSFDGGINGAERVRAVLTNPDWGVYSRDELFTALKISYRRQDTLSHRDILSALMALGIERDVIGDIVCGDGVSMLVCLPELGGFIIENLTKAGRVGITVSEMSLSEFPEKQEELTIKTDTVASLRLDALLCAAFGLSRANAAELISSARVSLNHQPCQQQAKELSEGMLLSVRGIGRAKLLEVGGTSRKRRTFVRIGIYGR